MLGEYKKAKFPKANKIPSGINLSQIAISNSNKFFFMTTGEVGLPGSIRISSYPLTNVVHETFVKPLCIFSLNIIRCTPNQSRK